METWEACVLVFTIVIGLQLLLRAVPLPSKINTWALARRATLHEKRARFNEYLVKVSTQVERDYRRPIGFRVGEEE